MITTPMDDLLRADAEARERALAVESFICEAPAGAGKTELLTQRYLRLLALAEEPEEVVAITFTNKAAGEMRERIEAALGRARRGEMPEAAHHRVTHRWALAALARDADRGWSLAAQPARLRLTTIDALCASLARQMPLLTRFGATPAITEDASEAYIEAAQRVVNRVDEEAIGEVVALALQHLDNDSGRLVRLLAAMLGRREQWADLFVLAHPESALEENLRRLIELRLSAATAGFDAEWQAPLRALARFAAGQLGGGVLADWQTPLQATLDDLPRWRALTELLLTREGTRRERIDTRQGFPATHKAEKAAMLGFLSSLSEGDIVALRQLRDLPQLGPDADAPLIRALIGLLQLTSLELWRLFRERGEIDFPELAIRALAALGQAGAPSELALRLDYRIRHLLVDEFQDTSPTQVKLLELLCAGWQPGDGRTLFVVGDPMQSIYRFRKAEVGLFLQAAQRGIGDLPLQSLRLSRNNRADPLLVAWINARFPSLFGAQDDPLGGCIAYRPFVATRGADATAAVRFHPVWATGDEERAEVRRAEGRAVAALIANERAQRPSGTVAVLARAKEHLAPVAEVLRREYPGLAFCAVEIETLLARQGIQDLLALTRALHHRGDRLNWLAVLRAPWCGLSLADLHALAADQAQATIPSLLVDDLRLARLSGEGATRARRVRDILLGALAGQGRQPLRRWVEEVWHQLGGELALGPDGRADAQSFFSRLEALEQGGFDLDRLEDDMSRLFAAPAAGPDCGVQLMSIHKSKGLEFDTVIVTGLAATPRPQDPSLLVWDGFPLPGGEAVVCAPLNARGPAGDGVPSAYDFLQGLERERGRNEEARLLYVAATRAIRCLHMTGVVRPDGNGAIRPPRSGALLERLWPVLDLPQAPALDPAAIESQEAPGLLDTFVAKLERLPLAALPPVTLLPEEPLAPPVGIADEGDPFAAAIGTLVHACLERIAGAVEAWPAARASEFAARGEAWMRGQGWSAAEARRGAEQAVAMLWTTLASVDGRWMLQRHDAGAAELALAKVGAGETAPVKVVDRTFVVDGRRWIIDYKTAAAARDEAPQQLAQRAARHRAQLDGYAELFADEGLPVSRAIFFTACGALVVLD